MKYATSSKTHLRLRKDLVVGLEHLRSETREISRLYAANLQRDMVQLMDFVNAAGPAHLRDMKEVLDEINVKPEKGRRKDLRRIEQGIRSMLKAASARKVNGG
jgi:hypothetical protein